MPTATPLTLSPAPSQCSLEDFVSHYGDVYEHSPWVAEAAWHQGLRPKHDNPDALAELMGLMLRQATPEQQIAVVVWAARIAERRRVLDIRRGDNGGAEGAQVV